MLSTLRDLGLRAITNPGALIAIALVWALGVVRYVWWRVFSHQERIPETLPWAGAPTGGAIARGKAAMRSFLGLRQMLLDGYSQYSKNGESFVLPNLVNGHEVILPTTCMSWLLEQPESVLSQFETNRQFMCGDYTTLGLLGNGWSRVNDRAKREMSQGIDGFVDAMVDETQDSLRSLLGNNTQAWHEVVLYDVMLEAMGRVVGRVLVGLPLCRNPGYVQASTNFSKYVLLPAMFIELLPSFLKPILGPVVTFWDKVQYWRIKSWVAPMFEGRLWGEKFDKSHHDHSALTPGDYIQWVIRDALRHGEDPNDPHHKVTNMKRLAIITFTAVQSSAITITNAIFDIAAHPDSIAVQEELRSEVTTAQGSWERAALSHLSKLDSALTETLRLGGILTHGVTKTVVAPDGITIPTGEHVPHGGKVGIASYGPHLDEDFYGTEEASASVYDPFRFTRPQLASKRRQTSSPGLGFVTTSEHYMGFSHGRSACPGRFFANSLLKIVLGHILLHYDIAPMEKRPTNPWLNNTMGPPVGARIKVRRRR
ncbi:cytochrome P450 [Podospora aff. communis PSN243]|uniref:Cytochrome P450 n=1 Tax=Podospora aff. communis PSN243 TaxID=3040156 RepID=A0AAV9GKA9_9PEZI|nr:cytochrome P450 [Podospora aff. communis PSN243]